MRLPTFVCLLARLLKNAWMDLDEMLHVDRGRDMEELINFWAQSRSQSRCRNQKIDDVSKSVKQAPHSNHVMHCRKILFTPRCSPRAREFLRSVDFSVRRTVVELRGVKVAQFSDFGLFSPYKISLQPIGYIAEWLRFFHVVVDRELWSLLTTYRKSYMGFSKNPLLDP